MHCYSFNAASAASISQRSHIIHQTISLPYSSRSLAITVMSMHAPLPDLDSFSKDPSHTSKTYHFTDKRRDHQVISQDERAYQIIEYPPGYPGTH
jgi:hypothetical protein